MATTDEDIHAVESVGSLRLTGLKPFGNRFKSNRRKPSSPKREAKAPEDDSPNIISADRIDVKI